MALTKIDIARHQLGTALDLFIRYKDPVSVHSLACGGCELLQGLAIVSTVSPFFNDIQTTYPDLSHGEITRLQNQYWNAFKHFYKPNKRDVRDDNEILAAFSDNRNDAPLFVAGRPCVRAAFYMAALVAARTNPKFKQLYKNMRDAGKPAKVALVALARRIVALANALIRDNLTFDESHFVS
jgi:hypothetical protein